MTLNHQTQPIQTQPISTQPQLTIPVAQPVQDQIAMMSNNPYMATAPTDIQNLQFGQLQQHHVPDSTSSSDDSSTSSDEDNIPCQLLAANSWRFLFAHICRNSLFIICSLQNSSYCLLSTISGIFTINALLQQPCVPFHFDKQASFATSTPTNFCLQNHKCFLRQVKDFMV